MGSIIFLLTLSVASNNYVLFSPSLYISGACCKTSIAVCLGFELCIDHFYHISLYSVKSTVQAMEVCRKSIYDLKGNSVVPGLLSQGTGITFTLNNHINQLQSQLGAQSAAAAAGDMSQYLQYHLQVCSCVALDLSQCAELSTGNILQKNRTICLR